jgi:peptidoglycan/xylan/chitin deacetylase (PgdA/CDA1 family)
MSLRSQLGSIRPRILSSLWRRTVALGNLGPVVSFTFDDFPRSALIAGANVIEQFGARATYYVAMGLMNTENRLGAQFCCADLHSLLDRGHEVAVHGFSHLSARKTPIEKFVGDVAHCERAIRECIPRGVSNNFAYPYGEASLSAKRRLGPKMGSSRGTIQGLNGPEVDLNLLRANPLYGDIEQVERVRKLIVENQAERSWLIFYSHDVAETPSPYGCTPSLLQEAVSFAVSLGAKVMTVADVVISLVPAA